MALPKSRTNSNLSPDCRIERLTRGAVPSVREGAVAITIAVAVVLSLGTFGQSKPSASTRSSAQRHSHAPTFYKDVLPILQDHCQACHREGEIAPMSFMTYEQTRPWA